MDKRATARVQPMPRALWVTSFAPDMWRVSGQELVRSFRQHKVDGQLLVCTEGSIPGMVQGPTIVSRDISSYPFLTGWLAANADYIPASLGGSRQEPLCGCPGGPFPADPKGHKPACLGCWWQKNHSRWFRKIAAMKMALDMVAAKEIVPPDVFVWVDSDCKFLRRIDPKRVGSWFGRADCFYFKHTRPVLEAGVVGYRASKGGLRLLTNIIDRYVSGRYRQSPRWDDSAQIQEAIAETKVAAVDLARSRGQFAAVIPYSPLSGFLSHDKGRHGRKLKIMT